MSFRRALAIGLFLTALSPAAARADGLIIPFAAVNFGGAAGTSIGDAADANQFGYGVSFMWMGGGVFGFEGDLGYGPDFYGKSDVGGSSVLSVMGNVLLGVPFGGQTGFGVRPYGLVGLGALRSDLPSFDERLGFDNTELAWDFGGGLMVFFGRHVGIRGNLRYFRSFGEVDFGPIELGRSEAVDYARGSAGLVLRF